VEISTGLSNSFGFGGHNAAIVLKKYEWINFHSYFFKW
jgi:3-oxoacyl-[acyl-carrier-protein] synthase II